jgi:hypothetical protein
MENRDKNKINLNKVIEFLNTQQPTILNRLIKEVLNPKKDNGVQQKPESTQKTVYKKPHSTNDGFIPVVNKKFKKQPHQSLLKYNKQETKPKNE